MKQIITVILLLCSTYNNAQDIVRASVYWGVESQCDDTPTVTADGTKFNPLAPPRLIAISPDLLKDFPFGCYVYVRGCGDLDGAYRVADVMNERYNKSIDILCKVGVMGLWSLEKGDCISITNLSNYHWSV